VHTFQHFDLCPVSYGHPENRLFGIMAYEHSSIILNSLCWGKKMWKKLFKMFKIVSVSHRSKRSLALSTLRVPTIKENREGCWRSIIYATVNVFLY